MSKFPQNNSSRGFVWWLSRIARVVSLPVGASNFDDDGSLGKIVDRLPMWLLFIVIPFAVGAAFAIGIYLAGFVVQI